MLIFEHGFQLNDVRRYAQEGRIKDPVVVHHNGGFTLFFCLEKRNRILENCVLITNRARPREWKKARTYLRELKSSGIPRWRVRKGAIRDNSI